MDMELRVANLYSRVSDGLMRAVDFMNREIDQSMMSNPIVDDTMIGGFGLEKIPPKAYLTVAFIAGVTYGEVLPSEIKSNTVVQFVAESIHACAEKQFRGWTESTKTMVLEVIALVETKPGSVKVFIRHLVAEVCVDKPEDDCDERQVYINSLAYL